VRTRVAALLAGLFLVLGAVPAHATADLTRLAGANRYDTAAAINCCNPDGTPRQFSTIVLASGVHFADAMVGSFLAGVDNGILLLTDGTTISQGTHDLLSSADPDTVSNVYVMGGTAAVSQSAIDAASDALAEGGSDVRVTRVAGDTAVDTAVAAANLRASAIGKIGADGKWAIVAGIGGLADSLAAAPLSFSSKLPILFTRPGDLPNETRDALDDLGITNVLIVGGTAAVSNEVSSSISDLGITVQRLAGPTRQETAVSVGEFELGNDPEFDGKEFSLARGDSFADALAGASHAGIQGAPILLTQTPTQLGFAAAGFLQRQSGTLETGWVYGGTGAVSDDVVEQARTASQGT